MSLRREEQTVPEHKSTVVVATVCDLCGREKRNYGGDPNVDWGEDSYDVDDTIVRWESGTRYPDCSSITRLQWHICPRCFRDKLLPWLASQGAKPTETEIETG